MVLLGQRGKRELEKRLFLREGSQKEKVKNYVLSLGRGRMTWKIPRTTSQIKGKKVNPVRPEKRKGGVLFPRQRQRKGLGDSPNHTKRKRG